MKGKIKTKLRVNDEVVVIAGKDRGKRGKILSFFPEKSAVLVQGVNMMKKTVKKSDEHKQGGFVEKEVPVHISNVMFYSSSLKKGVRLGWVIGKDKTKERAFRKSGKMEIIK